MTPSFVLWYLALGLGFLTLRGVSIILVRRWLVNNGQGYKLTTDEEQSLGFQVLTLVFGLAMWPIEAAVWIWRWCLVFSAGVSAYMTARKLRTEE